MQTCSFETAQIRVWAGLKIICTRQSPILEIENCHCSISGRYQVIFPQSKITWYRVGISRRFQKKNTYSYCSSRVIRCNDLMTQPDHTYSVCRYWSIFLPFSLQNQLEFGIRWYGRFAQPRGARERVRVCAIRWTGSDSNVRNGRLRTRRTGTRLRPDDYLPFRYAIFNKV